MKSWTICAIITYIYAHTIRWCYYANCGYGFHINSYTFYDYLFLFFRSCSVCSVPSGTLWQSSKVFKNRLIHIMSLWMVSFFFIIIILRNLQYLYCFQILIGNMQICPKHITLGTHALIAHAKERASFSCHNSRYWIVEQIIWEKISFHLTEIT